MTPETTAPASAPAPVVYMVHEHRIDALRATFAKLAKRAAKLGASPENMPGIAVGEPVAKHVQVADAHTGLERTVLVVRCPVTVTGLAPKIGGWRFAASLEHLHAADGTVVNVVRNISGTELGAEWATATPYCQHCKTRRRRNDTYVLRSDAGETKQVGKQCLKDFTGHESPEDLVALANLFADAVDGCTDGEGSGGSDAPSYWELLKILELTAQVISIAGWRSRKDCGFGAVATADIVSEVLATRPDDRAYAELAVYREISERSAAKGLAACDWLKTLSITDASEYVRNLAVLARVGAVNARQLGIAASVLVAHERELGRAVERAQKASRPASQHFGVVGQRAVFTLTVEKIHTYESDFGAGFIYILRDAAGNSAKWFTSKNAMDTGTTYTVKATVKAHDTWQGNGLDRNGNPFPPVAQTVLTRCTVQGEAPSEATAATA